MIQDGGHLACYSENISRIEQDLKGCERLFLFLKVLSNELNQIFGVLDLLNSIQCTRNKYLRNFCLPRKYMICFVLLHFILYHFNSVKYF